MKRMGSAFGYIIGTIVLVPLLLYIINVIFYTPREVTESQIDKYINNSYEIVDSVKTVSYREHQINEKLGFQLETIHLYLDRHGGGDRWYYGYVYYSKEYNKYFNLLVIVEGGGIITEVVQKIKDIILTVNRDDLNNPKYGTLDNPVPVLKFIGVNKSIRDNDLDYNKAYMDKMFHDNVEMYLKYIMPKEEFKERFK